MPKLKLDEAAVKKATLPPDKKQLLYFDTKTPGFGLLLGRTSKSFIYQRDLPGGVTRRVTLGRYPEMTLAQARQEAARKHAEMIDGIDPSAQRRERVRAQQRKAWETYTFKQARDHHILEMKAKQCSPRSMADIVELTDRHLSEWVDRPLANLTPAAVIEKHRKLTVDSGPVSANNVFACFRACYNAARRVHRELPENPAGAIVRNAQHRRREPVVDFAAWHAKVQSIGNPIRRDYQIFVALTGLRARDAASVRFSEVDWEAGTLTRPNPKGGAKRAFTVPLSRYVLALLAQRRLENERIYGGGDWAFPTRDRAGLITHLRVAREQRVRKDAEGKRHHVSLLPSPHRLRDSFISICSTEAGIDPITTKCLVNHRLPSGDVTTGYVRPSVEHMRSSVEKVTTILLGKMGVAAAVAGPAGAT